MFRFFNLLTGALMLCIISTASADNDVKITPEKSTAQVFHDGKLVIVKRIQDQDHELTGSFTKTSRKCPPFCIQPIEVSPGVETVGEIEVIDFMEKKVVGSSGILIDARTSSFYLKGTIPGSVNIPFMTFEAEHNSPELIDAMKLLGAKPREYPGDLMRSLEKTVAPLGIMGADMMTDHWDLSHAKEIMLWCNGPWCGQSPRAIRALLDMGYPAEKIHYYRGGMQMWQILGLSVMVPESSHVITERRGEEES